MTSIQLNYDQKSVNVSVSVVPREKEIIQVSRVLAKKLGIKCGTDESVRREVKCVTHLVEENKIVVTLGR